MKLRKLSLGLIFGIFLYVWGNAGLKLGEGCFKLKLPNLEKGKASLSKEG